MKWITILLSALLASVALASTAPRYVQEIVSSSGGEMAQRALNIVKSSDIRLNFAESFGFPTFTKYTEEKLDEGMSREEVNELYTSMFISSELQDFEIEQALTNDARLRAVVIASAFFTSSFLGMFTKQAGVSTQEEIEEYLQQSSPPMSFAQLMYALTQSGMAVANGLVMIFPAVDSPDKSFTELTNALSEIQMLKFDISYSDAYSDRMPEDNSIPADSMIAFAVSDGTGRSIGGNVGNYLNRTNHVTPAPINNSEKQFLIGMGITDEGILAMMPTGLPRNIAQTTMSGIPILGSDPNMVSELDYAVVIDLITESGSLFPTTATYNMMFNQKRYNLVKRYLDEELEYLGITMEELVALLRHPERPASLLQVLQMLHKDFSLGEIADFEYETIDAILISNAESKDKLFSELGYALDEEPTIASLNELIRSKGQLTLALLDKGYDLDDISPHFVPKRSFVAEDTGTQGEAGAENE